MRLSRLKMLNPEEVLLYSGYMIKGVSDDSVQHIRKPADLVLENGFDAEAAATS